MPPHNNPEKKPLLGGNGREASGDSNGSGALTARMAYESANAEASRQYHESRGTTSASHGGSSDEGWHQSEGGLLKPVIFGGLDGILTSFAIVAGSAGGGLDPTVVLVLGFSNIFADALR